MPDFSFASQLKRYVDLLKKTHAEVASDLDIHKTKLSRLLNEKENPNIDLLYRLEHHSGGMIPAAYWYKLYAKKREEDIKRNKEERSSAYKRVRNRLEFDMGSGGA